MRYNLLDWFGLCLFVILLLLDIKVSKKEERRQEKGEVTIHEFGNMIDSLMYHSLLNSPHFRI